VVRTVTPTGTTVASHGTQLSFVASQIQDIITYTVCNVGIIAQKNSKSYKCYHCNYSMYFLLLLFVINIVDMFERNCETPTVNTRN
jgi:hypothetical protein